MATITRTINIANGVGPTGPAGSDATVTESAVISALGFTPASATKFAAGAGTLTGPASNLTIGTAAAAATGDFAAASHTQAASTISDSTVAGRAILTAADAAAQRSSMDVDQSALPYGRLAKFRERLDTLTLAPVIAFFGDSMLEAYSTNIKLRDAFHKAFGMGGYAYLNATASGGATGVNLDFTDFFIGRFTRISGSGHMATINVDGIIPVEANTLKLYYVRKPGAGVFKIQTRLNGGTWTDEPSYLTVSADGVLSGQVIMITKTTLRAIWDIRAVWVSGSVDILGGGLYHTDSQGARLAMLAAGSTDMVNWLSAPAAVTQPIIADIAPHLCILSHLDGASGTNTHQATWQDNVNTWAATTPTWLVIGPPVGSSTINDAANAAQAEAQRTLASTRNDAFWDNRKWTNSTPAQAITRGFLYTDVDPHYTPLAQKNWIPLLLRETGLAESAYRGTAGGKAGISLLLGPEMRRSRRLAGGGDNYAMEITGDLELAPPDGRTGYGRLLLHDIAGPVNANDFGGVQFNNNGLNLILNAVHRVTFDQPIGQLRIFDPTSTAGTPNGQLGTITTPFQQLFIGADIRPGGDWGNKTQNFATGRIRVQAGQQTVTVTNNQVSANSRIVATLGAVDATATSCAVVAGAGSFVITLNAACTAEMPVNWVNFP